MDDIEEMQWINVQDPVRQMITSITKAVRTQSAGIRDLDRKIGFLASTDTVHAMISEASARSFQKQDAIILAENIATKADSNDVLKLESNLQQVSHQLSRLNEVLQDQNSAIRDLNNRVTRLADEVDDMRNPNYDKIFAYVDKQVQKLHTDMTDKLAVKADLREVERSVPQKVDEVYRLLMGEVKAMQKDLARTATKEEFHVLLASKAEGNELRNLAAEVSKCVTKQEMQQTVTAQVRPVVTAISSLEKVIQIQEDRRSTSALNAHTPVAPKQPVWNYDKIQSVVEDVLQQRYPHINESVTNRSLETSLAQHKEFLLHEMGSQVESVRLELAAAQRESVGVLRKKLDDRVAELQAAVKDSKDSSSRTKNGLKELASNVAKALAKKADRADLRKLNGAGGGGVSHAGYRDDILAGGSTYNPHLQHSVPGQGFGTDSALNAILQGHSHGQTTTHTNTLTSDVQSIRKELATIMTNHHDNRTEISHLRRDLTAEIEDLQAKVLQLQENKRRNGSHTSSPTTPADKVTSRRSANASTASSGGGGVGSSFTEWRMALGDLSLNVRREMSEKCSREEMHAAIGAELGTLEKRLLAVCRDVSSKADAEDVSRVDNALVDLRSKVAGELTGGRWLWTNGKIGKEGWVPWDTEVQNAAPAVLLWRQGATTITARIPGLYRITAAVFTSLPSALQICLNGEPILSLQPDVTDSASATNSQALREERYVMRRSRHSVGEVTCLSIDEHVSLPADSELTMRFHSAASAQAFFAIKKL